MELPGDQKPIVSIGGTMTSSKTGVMKAEIKVGVEVVAMAGLAEVLVDMVDIAMELVVGRVMERMSPLRCSITTSTRT